MLEKIIMQKALSIKDELISIRRDIHAHPEIGLNEVRTSALVAEKLRALGLEVKTNIGITGVLATLKGNHPGKTLLIRADMDCLEMTELNDVEYKSKYPGKMHACGHDAHTTWLLGCATILANMKEHIHGNVKFCFQPAEELEGGAERMIAEGILENPKVDAAIGAHVWTNIDSGKIGVRKGPMMAAPDMFHLTIHGNGGHAAHPDLTVDPISIANEIYTAFQTLISRKVDPLEPAVLSVTQFNAGTAHNIIPDTAELGGTVRTFSPELRQWFPTQMKKIAKSIAEAHGGTCDFEYEFTYPPVINDANMTDLVKEAAIEMLGEDNIVNVKNPSMGGEDFAYFGEKVPSTFIFVGTYNEEKGITAGPHNPHFDIDEEILYKASAVMANVAVNFLNK